MNPYGSLLVQMHPYVSLWVLLGLNAILWVLMCPYWFSCVIMGPNVYL